MCYTIGMDVNKARIIKRIALLATVRRHRWLLWQAKSQRLFICLLALALAGCGSPAPAPSLADRVDAVVAADGVPLDLTGDGMMKDNPHPDAYALVLDDCDTAGTSGNSAWFRDHLDPIVGSPSAGEAAALKVAVPLVCPAHTTDLP